MYQGNRYLVNLSNFISFPNLFYVKCRPHMPILINDSSLTDYAVKTQE